MRNHGVWKYPVSGQTHMDIYIYIYIYIYICMHRVWQALGVHYH